MRIVVVGGGIVGLTTAGFVQAGFFRNADITVLASNFDDTVSHVAAGLFRVGASFCGPSEAITRYKQESFCFYHFITYVLLGVMNAPRTYVSRSN